MSKCHSISNMCEKTSVNLVCYSNQQAIQPNHLSALWIWFIELPWGFAMSGLETQRPDHEHQYTNQTTTGNATTNAQKKKPRKPKTILQKQSGERRDGMINYNKIKQNKTLLNNHETQRSSWGPALELFVVTRGFCRPGEEKCSASMLSELPVPGEPGGWT